MSTINVQTEQNPNFLSSHRWRICALLFFATTINYIDRQVLSILAPQLQEIFNWSESDYGFIVSAFQIAYAGGFLIMGQILDRFGTKIGYSIAIAIWSVAAMGHSLAGSVSSFAVSRFFLGLGEAGNFPSAIKAVSEWFSEKERALAVGIFNSGSNIGAIIAPLAVPFIALEFGWRWAFIATGLLGLIWLIFWLKYYKATVPVSTPSVADVEKVSWFRLFTYKPTFAFAIGKFLTDPVWWFFLFWLPKFFNSEHGLTLDKIGPPLIFIYLFSDAGSIAGGWLSSFLIKKGYSVNRSRKVTMLLCALLVVPVYFTSQTGNLWLAVGFLGLATAAHQAWSANLFTLVSDMFPQKVVGSVIGIGGTAGAIGGVLIAIGTGYLIEWTGSYTLIFLVASTNYLIAFVLIHWLCPKLKPVDLRV